MRRQMSMEQIVPERSIGYQQTSQQPAERIKLG